MSPPRLMSLRWDGSTRTHGKPETSTRMFSKSTNPEAQRDVKSGREPGARAGKVKISKKIANAKPAKFYSRKFPSSF